MYEDFAHVYDRFMPETPYRKWTAYINDALKNIGAKTVLDLACGTGSVTVPLARLGYDMTAVDISADMLSEARLKADEAGLEILFLMQDIRRLDLYDTVDAAICCCDAINYLLDENDLLAAFKRVALFLNPGGIFIFDIGTEYKYKEILGCNTFTETVDGASYVWRNEYDEATGFNDYDIFFIVNDPPMRFSEQHRQRCYSTEAIAALLNEAGLDVKQINDAYTDDPPSRDSERVSFVAVKK
jgi:ubiquinone/menaquinone biosynthesis C-methylase UbiE